MNIEIYSAAYGNIAKDFAISPQKINRAWMSTPKNAYSYKCLPLRIANELGWQIECPTNFTCVWDGGESKESIKFSFENPNDLHKNSTIKSYFGSGILTFGLPYIIRTPKKKSIYIRGPTNFYKEYCQYLDAVIETDWMNYYFTYNIKINKKDSVISFSKGEPICSFIILDLEEISNTQLINKDINKNKTLKRLQEFFTKKRIKNPSHNLDYYKGGYKGPQFKIAKTEDFKKQSIKFSHENKAIGCPFLHFNKLNLKEIQNPTFKNKFNFFKSKIYKKITFIKYLILNIIYFTINRIYTFTDKIHKQFIPK
jgi:hypothetical protein